MLISTFGPNHRVYSAVCPYRGAASHRLPSKGVNRHLNLAESDLAEELSIGGKLGGTVRVSYPIVLASGITIWRQ